MEETTNKIRKLLAEASPGPWATSFGYEQSERGNYVYSVANGLILCAEQDDTDCVLETEDANLIVGLRNHIEEILGKLEDAREALEPFAEAGRIVTQFGPIPPDKVWLWVRTSNKIEEDVGITQADCLRAAEVLDEE
jgi:hypothetical protein